MLIIIALVFMIAVSLVRFAPRPMPMVLGILRVVTLILAAGVWIAYFGLRGEPVWDRLFPNVWVAIACVFPFILTFVRGRQAPQKEEFSPPYAGTWQAGLVFGAAERRRGRAGRGVRARRITTYSGGQCGVGRGAARMVVTRSAGCGRCRPFALGGACRGGVAVR